MKRLPSICFSHSFFRSSQFLLIAGLSIAGFTALSIVPTLVEATETDNSQQVAANSDSWRTASFPVENFQDYTSPFGYRSDPYGGGTRFHYGLDMAAPRGSYIRNWWAGSVIEVSDDSACGTSVVLQSGDWIHIYCHMEGYVEVIDGQRSMVDRDGGVIVYEGQQIPTGARIGRVGMSGRTTGPHLHWGLQYSDNWVDPGMVLRAMYEQQRASAVPSTTTVP